MRQLVVLIGVRQPGGGLGELKSIRKCLEDMRDWALGQLIPRSDIKIFTDIPELVEAGDDKQLSVDHIFNWIDARAKESQPADQLVIYFSGHGMQSGGTPLWLLPQAPKKTWEAVNLDLSRELAVWSRFKHIVFIGDCCSTVADNAQFDEVKGASILENIAEELRISARPVDNLRAARPGKESIEITINSVSQSPYTVQLVNTLSGTPSTILEAQTPGVPQPVVLRVRKLADELRTSVNSFLRANGITPPGPPLDNVESTTQWIAHFAAAPTQSRPQTDLPTLPPRLPHQPEVGSGPVGWRPSDLKDVQLDLGISDRRTEFEKRLIPSLDTELIEIAATGLTGIIEGESSNIPDGYHYETQCGFFATGAVVRSAVSRTGIECQVLSGQEIRINPETMELVSIEFVGGEGIMIPAIPGQIGFIHVENGHLSSVAYEPSGHADFNRKSRNRQQFEVKSKQIRVLRDTLQNLVTSGDLSFADVSPETISRVIQHIHFGGRVDFSTLLYLAYAAYASKLAKHVVPLLAEYMQIQFMFVPFDLKILLSLARIDHVNYLEFAPPFPLLTQGWSLLRATHEQIPEELSGLSGHYRNSSWTHLDSQGVDLCRAYLAQQLPGGRSGSSGNPIADIPLVEELPLSWDIETFIKTPQRSHVISQAQIDDEEDRGATI